MSSKDTNIEAVRVATPSAPKVEKGGSWQTLWERRTTVIAACAVVGIALYLILRYGTQAGPAAIRAPLLVTLVLGGLPLLYSLGRKLIKLDFGSDLLAGVVDHG